MHRLRYLVLIWMLSPCKNIFAQESLPMITVKNTNGKIIVSWLNDFTKPISHIIIQRSYDSLKNFTSIGTVINPLNKENGYLDNQPPYTKMYYRLSISFEGGAYIVGPSVRPVKEKLIPVLAATDSSTLISQPEIPEKKTEHPGRNPVQVDTVTLKPKKENEITYPSNRLFTSKQQTLVIHLPEAGIKQYRVRILDENDRFLFELTKLTEEYLILEKVNFVRAGWFHFELFENGKLIEKNKFFISKDPKSNK